MTKVNVAVTPTITMLAEEGDAGVVSGPNDNAAVLIIHNKYEHTTPAANDVRMKKKKKNKNRRRTL